MISQTFSMETENVSIPSTVTAWEELPGAMTYTEWPLFSFLLLLLLFWAAALLLSRGRQH